MPEVNEFSCLRIDESSGGEIRPLESLFSGPGTLRAIFSFGPHVMVPPNSRRGVVAELWAHRGWVPTVVPLARLDEWEPCRAGADPGKQQLLLAVDAGWTFSEVGAVFSRLRGCLVRDGGLGDCTLTALCDGVAWDVVDNRTRYSPLDSSFGYEEWLVWFDGGLAAAEVWRGGTPARTRTAWAGAGWIGRRHRRLADGSPPELPDTLTAHIVDAYGELRSRASRLLAPLNGGGLQAAGYPSHSYRRALCEFLPPHYSREWRTYVPSMMSATQGGPRRWRSMVDAGLDLHTRHLLLDGWLIPFRCGDEIYIQPASLALLYWAAREEGKPHTRRVADFLDYYDWHADPHWFGGHWRPDPPKGGRNG